jgi:threonine/homoserine/homoserine lactone efflux protein
MQDFPVALVLTSVPFLASMGLTPGPNNILLASSGVNFGFRATVPHLLGVTVGYPIMLLLVGVGMAQLFTNHPEIHVVLKYICVAYLLYLAWRVATAASAGESGRAAKPFTFVQAVLFQWVNGKGWVTALSAVTTYTLVNSTLTWQVVAIAALSMLVTLVSVITWTLFGAVLRQYLHTERRRRIFNYTMATLLVLSIIPVFFE